MATELELLDMGGAVSDRDYQLGRKAFAKGILTRQLMFTPPMPQELWQQHHLRCGWLDALAEKVREIEERLDRDGVARQTPRDE